MNGQIQDKVTINLPASELLNRNLPANVPKIWKNAQHNEPRSVQETIVFFIMWVKELRFWRACISATVGSSMVDTAFEMADGNKMHGSAIPVSTP